MIPIFYSLERVYGSNTLTYNNHELSSTVSCENTDPASNSTDLSKNREKKTTQNTQVICDNTCRNFFSNFSQRFNEKSEEEGCTLNDLNRSIKVLKIRKAQLERTEIFFNGQSLEQVHYQKIIQISYKKVLKEIGFSDLHNFICKLQSTKIKFQSDNLYNNEKIAVTLSYRRKICWIDTYLTCFFLGDFIENELENFPIEYNIGKIDCFDAIKRGFFKNGEITINLLLFLELGISYLQEVDKKFYMFFKIRKSSKIDYYQTCDFYGIEESFSHSKEESSDFQRSLLKTKGSLKTKNRCLEYTKSNSNEMNLQNKEIRRKNECLSGNGESEQDIDDDSQVSGCTSHIFFNFRSINATFNRNLYEYTEKKDLENRHKPSFDSCKISQELNDHHERSNESKIQKAVATQTESSYDTKTTKKFRCDSEYHNREKLTNQNVKSEYPVFNETKQDKNNVDNEKKKSDHFLRMSLILSACIFTCFVLCCIFIKSN